MSVFSNGGKLWLSLVTVVVMVPSQAQAQIVPDDTLGAESSSLVLDQLVRGETADLIMAARCGIAICFTALVSLM